MKKLTLLLTLLTFLVSALAFTACDGIGGGTQTEAHVCVFREWIITKEATCTEDGEEERSCECGEKETNIIDALGHSEVIDEGVAPTCTETGLTEGAHCSACGEVFVAQETIMATGHTETLDAAVDPTCTETGLTEGTHCSVCETVLVAQETVPASHTWDEKYGWDKDKHWQNCTECEVASDKVAHTLCADGYCAVCNNPIAATDGVMYAVSTDGTYAEVVDYVGDSQRVVIAEEYEGLPVKLIGDQAFKDKSITSIYIAANVEGFGTDVFLGCSSLQTVEFAKNSKLTIIPERLFYNLGALTLVSLPDSVTSIESRAFEDCGGLVNIRIPDGITYISHIAFVDCSFQWNVYDNARYLGNENNPYVVLVESRTTSITSCTINSATKYIYGGAFYNCRDLTSITIPNGVTCIGTGAFEFCGLTSVTIPNSVTSIGIDAFGECTSLTSVTIPDSVTSIGSYAFDNCSRLESINFGGTKAQWGAIFKDWSWDHSTGNYTLYCIDGTISKSK